jgi:F-type H+-transporting ATPase subunit alpha
MLHNYFKYSFKDFVEIYKEVGEVTSLNSSFVNVTGLHSARINDVVYFEDNSIGIVSALNIENIEIILLNPKNIKIQTKVVNTNSTFQIKLSDNLFGNIYSPLELLFGDPSLDDSLDVHLNLFESDTSFTDRIPIDEPFETGVSIVDMLVPLGKGQRQLILGDNKTGKTQFVLQALKKQSRSDSICLLSLIGKSPSEIENIYSFIQNNGFIDKVIFVVSYGSDPLGSIYLNPFITFKIAEYYRDMGKNVTVVLDDMTFHASYYRELSLLQKKFPGRNSYPSDMFFQHASLLERAGNFMTSNGRASITALPICKTVGNDISGYIQTNLMSITDGHLFFDSDYFISGRRPSINPFLSVTRVGRQTQTNLNWTLSREIFSFFSLLEKNKEFIRFGSNISDSIKQTIQMGENLNAFFNQSLNTVYSFNVQILVFSLVWLKLLENTSDQYLTNILSRFEDLYTTDSAFNAELDSVVNTSADLNEFLGNLAQQKDLILGYINEN